MWEEEYQIKIKAYTLLDYIPELGLIEFDKINVSDPLQYPDSMLGASWYMKIVMRSFRVLDRNMQYVASYLAG